MNCYDCATIGHQTSAVAICIDCGAAACVEHLVVVRTTKVHRTSSLVIAAGSCPSLEISHDGGRFDIQVAEETTRDFYAAALG